MLWIILAVVFLIIIPIMIAGGERRSRKAQRDHYAAEAQERTELRAWREASQAKSVPAAEEQERLQFQAWRATQAKSQGSKQP